MVTSSKRIRVLILVGHEGVRQGLKELLENDGFEIVGQCGTAAEAKELTVALKPDVALVDDRLPDSSGIKACRDLRSVNPAVKCLILTGWNEHHALRAAVLAGSAGYVIKQAGTNDLTVGIHHAAAGGSLIHPKVRTRVVEGLHAAAAAPWMEDLTGMEGKVLSFMAHGLTNRQIRQELALTDETVEVCISSVLEKLGFRRWNRATPAKQNMAGPLP